MSTIRNRPAGARRPAAMYAGLALTIVATLAPLADILTVDTLTRHVRDAYPAWSPGQIAGDRNAIALFLGITGVLGIICWLVTIRAVRKGRRWARIGSTAALGLAVLMSLVTLTLGGAPYDVVVPPTFGVLTLLPCLAGLVAVVSLWRQGSRA
ncbi:hypothetical protein [Nonomuraea typhae]|uniref:hypothetical protein n=1 Tax=Nonomuraea typhae TaxID=2603600 RepID=UPI0012FA0DE8|nr:hypothetical protein [Nonomuraea typhae]